MTAPTLTLADFLLARIAEDEARVTLVSSAPPKWTMTVYPHDGERVPVEVAALTPARVLAECGAKRRIVERYRVCEPNYDEGNRLETRVLDWTMHLLALPYASHPDYRADWA